MASTLQTLAKLSIAPAFLMLASCATTPDLGVTNNVATLGANLYGYSTSQRGGDPCAIKAADFAEDVPAFVTVQSSIAKGFELSAQHGGDSVVRNPIVDAVNDLKEMKSEAYTPVLVSNAMVIQTAVCN